MLKTLWFILFCVMTASLSAAAGQSVMSFISRPVDARPGSAKLAMIQKEAALDEHTLVWEHARHQPWCPAGLWGEADEFPVTVTDPKFPPVPALVHNTSRETSALSTTPVRIIRFTLSGRRDADETRLAVDEVSRTLSSAGLQSLLVSGTGQVVIPVAGERPVAGWLTLTRSGERSPWSTEEGTDRAADVIDTAWTQLP